MATIEDVFAGFTKKKRQYKAEKSPAQKVVHQLGMDLFATGSTTSLIKFFRNNGMPNAASQLEHMLVDARCLARVKYENARRELDPSWKSPSELANDKWFNNLFGE